MPDQAARYNMVEQQVRPWDVTNPDVLAAMTTLPREPFVLPKYQNLAYSDTSLPLEEGQVMLAPKVIGRLLQAINCQTTDTVLEIGTGSGYLTTLLATLTKQVTTVEIHKAIAQQAKKQFSQLAMVNIQCSTGNGFNNLQSGKAFDIIVLTGSTPSILPQFTTSMKVGSRLFAFIGEDPAMKAILLTQKSPQHFTQEVLFETLVPSLLEFPQQETFIF